MPVSSVKAANVKKVAPYYRNIKNKITKNQYILNNNTPIIIIKIPRPFTILNSSLKKITPINEMKVIPNPDHIA
ncbi:hypothetical protein GsuE55_13510 [Geobacillus subterraneus]|uniref:Uncharacterized protein n=1 Tax=Geobacillus subterraneus TaxID=129338 RepID=A0A679FJU6_9BACL|nr:hypothetical protein GsuE55_13510 [Geobacillus subterraneus]